jgi:hypothetical protein
MPVVEGNTPIASVLGEPRSGFSRHSFRGGNFFMLRMLNRYREELGMEALPQELDASAHGAVEHLQSEAATVSVTRADVTGGRLEVEVSVENLAGHKLPTAYPSRRAWLHFTVRDRNGRTYFESGAIAQNGAIEGNDNDTDPAKYEPSYTHIQSRDEVQIYEAIMVDREGTVTTGLLFGARFVKDNRLLPLGFDKATAGEDIAVRGQAANDPDFVGGGDRVRYSVDVAGADRPLQIEAELWYQPIAYRWAQNLRQHDAVEIDRFLSLYESLSEFSAVVLARAAATAQ